MKQLEITGFIVGRKSLKDTDKIITVFSKEQGKISFIAKGIKRPTAKLQSHMEPLVETKFRVLASTKLPIVVAARAIGKNRYSSKTIEINISGLLLTEVVEMVTVEQMPNAVLYRTYRQSLADIASSSKTSLMLGYALLGIMQASGIAPNIQLREGVSRYYFNFSEGSLDSSRVGHDSTIMNTQVAKLWKVCLEHHKSTVRRLDVNDQILSESLNLLLDFLQYSLGRKIKAVKVLSTSTNLLQAGR